MNAPALPLIVILFLACGAVPTAHAQSTNPQSRLAVEIPEDNITFGDVGETRQVPFKVRIALGNTACVRASTVPIVLTISEKPGFDQIEVVAPTGHNYSISVGYYGQYSYSDVGHGNLTLALSEDVTANISSAINLTANFRGGTIENCTGSFPPAQSGDEFAADFNAPDLANESTATTASPTVASAAPDGESTPALALPTVLVAILAAILRRGRGGNPGFRLDPIEA